MCIDLEDTRLAHHPSHEQRRNDDRLHALQQDHIVVTRSPHQMDEQRHEESQRRQHRHPSAPLEQPDRWQTHDVDPIDLLTSRRRGKIAPRHDADLCAALPKPPSERKSLLSLPALILGMENFRDQTDARTIHEGDPIAANHIAPSMPTRHKARQPWTRITIS